MKNPLMFIVEIFKQPLWVIAWIHILVVANLGAFAFWGEPLAQWIIGIFLVQVMLMMGIYSFFGYEKIMGLAHAFWFPLVAYILLNLADYSGAFFNYLIGLLVINTISLVFDIIDVIAFFKSRRVD